MTARKRGADAVAAIRATVAGIDPDVVLDEAEEHLLTAIARTWTATRRRPGTPGDLPAASRNLRRRPGFRRPRPRSGPRRSPTRSRPR